jgi:hypothetical protein
MRKPILLMACCLLGWGTHLFAQQDAVSAGGTANGTGGSVTYTIGETNYSNTTGNGGTITQGVQQPFEIYLVSIKEMSLAVDMSLFPNPTNDYVILNIPGGNIEDLMYQLYDMNGKILIEKKLDGTQTNIYMANYAAATYFIKVTNSKNESKEFKLIKN